jgi:pimeloyl-ACP methyl ester carboxylesterase
MLICILGPAHVTAQESAALNTRKPGELRIEPHTFEASGQKVQAELGTFMVPENRSNSRSNLIELAFLRFKSTAKNPGAPIVYLAGGPGESGINTAKGTGLSLFLALREIADVIALDQRATGSSKPGLTCSEVWNFPLDKPGNPKEMLTIATERVRPCAQALAKQGIDLSGYNTRENAEDVESLRVALGIKKITLWGISYGTHLALAMLRLHETSVDRVILTGVSGMDNAMLKLPGTIQDQLVKADQQLKADPNLSKENPDLIGLLNSLFDKLEKNPATIEVADQRTGQKERVTIGGWDLQFFTAGPITQTWGLRALPSFYTALSKGDLTPIARSALDFRRGRVGSLMPVLMICSSGASAERIGRVRQEAGQTVLGNTVNFLYPDACASFGFRHLGRGFRAPVRSDVPVLMISGTMDGRTPVSNAQEVQKTLPNSRHVVIEGASHGYDLFFFIPKIQESMLEFLKQDLHK